MASVYPVLIVGALLPALFFKGPQIEWFVLSQTVLIVWIGCVSLQLYRSGWQLPKSGLAFLLSLWWLWLALSIIWSRAPNISLINFGWIGNLVLVFWLVTLTPNQDKWWERTRILVLIVGVALSVLAAIQVEWYGAQARSVFETRNSHAAFVNVLILPVSAYFLAHTHSARSRHIVVGLGGILSLFFISVLLTASRGALISLLTGLTVLLLLTSRTVSRRGIFWLIGIFLVACLCVAALPGPGGVKGEMAVRLPQLLQDTGRQQIWESSWKLLNHSPWYGIGLGLFYLAYPPYRQPTDQSGGYFAHNDFLQIWIETGWPGLVLLLSVFLATLWLFARVLRQSKLNRQTRVEIIGLFAALLVVAVHSAVDFNLYIPSIVMLVGLLLGRYHTLANRSLTFPVHRWQPNKSVGKRFYTILILLILLVPSLYFFTLGASQFFYARAVKLIQHGDLESADQKLATAQNLSSWDDRVLVARADLYRKAIALLPADASGARRVLFQDSLQYLNQAERANSLRAIPYLVRGQLLLENAQFMGPTSERLAEDALREALKRDPTFFQARTVYGATLWEHGRRQEALDILEKGTPYAYYAQPGLGQYYRLTARFNREMGYSLRAEVLEEKARRFDQLTK